MTMTDRDQGPMRWQTCTEFSTEAQLKLLNAVQSNTAIMLQLVGVTSTILTEKGIETAQGPNYRDLCNLYSFGIARYSECDPPLMKGDIFEIKGLSWYGGNIFQCKDNGITQLNPKQQHKINRKDVKIYEFSLIVYQGLFCFPYQYKIIIYLNLFN